MHTALCAYRSGCGYESVSLLGAGLFTHVQACIRVCVGVCVRERERESACACVCVCMCRRERECMHVSVCSCIRPCMCVGRGDGGEVGQHDQGHTTKSASKPSLMAPLRDWRPASWAGNALHHLLRVSGPIPRSLMPAHVIGSPYWIPAQDCTSSSRMNT
jgi:hypothetical protein